MQFNALQTIQAFEAGQGQRKEREREAAMKQFGNALANNDYGGAAKLGFQISPELGMQAQQYGDSRNALAFRKDIGSMIGAGDRKGAAAKAYSAGEFEMGANIDAQIAQMTQKQREDALFLSGELGNAALTLQGITDPQQRAAQWQQMQSRFVNDFGMDPAAFAEFNPMDDMALQRAIGEAQTFSDRLAGQRADAAAETEADRWLKDYNLRLRGVQVSESEAEAAAEARRLEAEAVPVPDLGDVKGIRETNEKRFQAFETSQRAFQSMEGLAQQGTGAADIALGFAFFKTFDPTSTVREGEFAQAAGAMGLGDRAVSIFARLDKGEQFTPQLRKELVDAAGIAYANQVADIQGLVERERAFAGRYGINPEDIARDPVRGQGGSDGTVFRGGAVNRIPQPAVQELLSDPSPEAMREFDEVFGRGQAQKIMQQQGRAPSRITF
jgi:hypothetical protein